MKQGVIIKKVLSYLKKYTFFMLLSIAFAAVIVGLTLYVPILIGNAIDAIVEGAVAFDVIRYYLVRVVAVVLVTALLQWLMNVINNHVTFHVARDIRKEAFDKLQILPLNMWMHIRTERR